MPEYLAPFVAVVVLILIVDQIAARWGGDSRHELGDRNW